MSPKYYEENSYMDSFEIANHLALMACFVSYVKCLFEAW